MPLHLCHLFFGQLQLVCPERQEFWVSCIIRGIMLIEDWCSTKTHEIGQFNFQSPPFYISNFFFSWKTLLSIQKQIFNALKYYWIKMSLFLTIKQLIFTWKNRAKSRSHNISNCVTLGLVLIEIVLTRDPLY